eukprot:3100935-Karenia_brevis.AAC.1
MMVPSVQPQAVPVQVQHQLVPLQPQLVPVSPQIILMRPVTPWHDWSQQVMWHINRPCSPNISYNYSGRPDQSK